MLAVLIFGVFCLTTHRLATTEITPEEISEMLNSDEWY